MPDQNDRTTASPHHGRNAGPAVAFDTTSRNSNLELIGFIRAYFDRLGVAYRISRDSIGTKANIHAIIGLPVAGGIALSGHVDTVPVDGQAWSTDPFTLRAADGRLYGRGTADMKGFVASALAAVPDLLARRLAQPVHLLITYDEETDMGGARRLIDDLAESGLRPALCVVGEPSLMQPILAHKGRLALRVTARGVAGHSSEPGRGVNAIHAVAEAIAWIAAEQRRFAAEGPFAEGFDPPHTTPHVGTVEGGTILNIIPEHAGFVMEWRTVPQDDFFAEVERLRTHLAAAIEPAMKAVDPACGFTLEVIDWIPGMDLAPRPCADLPGQAGHRFQQHRTCQLRHRGRAVPEGRHSHDRLRPGGHRAGTSGPMSGSPSPSSMPATPSSAALSRCCDMTRIMA